MIDQNTLPALKLAISWHAAQVRDDDEPYVIHPIRVAYDVYSSLESNRLYHISTYRVVCASLLHDVLEDTKCSREEILEVCGAEVLSVVEELTRYTEGETREIRHKALLEKARSFSAEAAIIKIADRYDNLRDAQSSWSQDRLRRYARETLELLEVLYTTDHYLLNGIRLRTLCEGILR